MGRRARRKTLKPTATIVVLALILAGLSVVVVNHVLSRPPAVPASQLPVANVRPAANISAYGVLPKKPAPTKPTKARRENVVRELTSKRTANTETWVTASGATVLRSFASRKYFRNDALWQRPFSGGTDWQPIDTTLVPDAGGGVRPRANDWAVNLPAQVSNGVRIGTGRNQVSMVPIGGSPTSVTTVGSTATYRGVWRNTDLEYTVSADMVKEDMVLRSQNAPTTFRFRFPGIALENDPQTPGALREVGMTKGWRIAPLSVTTALDTAVEARPTFTLERIGRDTIVTVSIDPNWFKALPAAAFPVRIDPSFSRSEDWNWWALKSDGFKCTNPTQDYCWPKVGSTNFQYWRTSMRFSFNELQGKTIQGAYMYVYVSDPVAGHNIQYDGLPVGAGHANCVDQFGCLDGARPQPQATVGKDGWLDLTSLYQRFQADNDWGAWLMLFGWETLARPTYKLLDPNYLHVDFYYNTPPPAPTNLQPADGARSLFPQASLTAQGPATDADGDAIKYRFTLSSTQSAGRVPAGQVADSFWLDSPKWTVPDGILQDGQTYAWSVCSSDYIDPPVCTGPNKLTIDTRNGKDPTQSFDSIAGMNVNLATGNLDTSVSTHSLSTLGGSLGLNLDYTTPSASRRGLIGRYYNDNAHTGVFPADPLTHADFTRVDPNVDFDWGTSSPATGAINGDYFLARWDGYFIAPKTGTYNFGTNGTDDGIRISVNDTVVVDSWNWAGPGAWSSDIALEEGQAVPIVVEYREIAGGAQVHLRVRGAVPDQPVPSDWLRTDPTTTPNEQGLVGEYYTDVNSNAVIDSADGAPFMVRRDQQVNFDWGTGSPVPGAPQDRFLVRWSGYFTAPAAGDYQFGAAGDDNVSVSVNGSNVVNLGCCQDLAAPSWGSTVTLGLGQQVPIVATLAEVTGGAKISLWVRGAVAPQPIQSSWLTPKTDVLPNGWHLSVDPDGNIGYERLQVSPTNATLLSPDGSAHSYTWTGTAYTPPTGEYGTLVRNADSTYTLHDADGRDYVFGVDGKLISVTSPLDDRKPSALRYIYGGNPSTLRRIEDSVDPSRQALPQYAGDATQGDCGTAPAGFESAPPGFLCALKTSDGRVTRFWYVNKNLARVELPGNSTVDYGYDSYGRINQLRDGLTADVINAGLAPDDETTRTTVTYDPVGRVQAVRLPQPDATQLGPEHTYEYGTSTTQVHTSGILEPAGYTRQTTYDPLLRTTSDANNQGLAITATWDPVKDLLLSTTDAEGRSSTTIYDDQDRATDTYGPAPASWFGSDRRPATHAADIPHSSTQYDGGIPGLAVAYYGNKDLVGAPGIHGTGIRSGTGDVVASWGASPPIAAGSTAPGSTGWGLRLTGYITIPEAGVSTFRLASDDAARLYINDQAVIDDWTAGANRSRTGTFNNPTAGARYRIRVDYADYGGGDAQLSLFRTPPGGAETSALGTLLTPDYGLTTRSTSFDAQAGNMTSAMTYAHPENGQLSSTTVDPGGLNLVSSTGYESPGSGFLRRTSRTLPAGNSYSYTYYGATEAVDNPCTVANDPVSQAGMARLTTDPDPDGSGPQVGRTHEVVYDSQGRVVASRINSDPWGCTTYDARGRAVQVVVPGLNGAPSRTVTNNYAVGGNSLVTSTTDDKGTITTTVDMLGRTVAYQDALGNTTTTTYDRNGLILTRTAAGATERYEYDSYQRPVAQYLDDHLLATTTYDQFGRIASVDYSSTPAVPSGSFDDLVNADTPADRWPFSATTLPKVRDSITGANGVAGPGVQAAAGQIPGGGDALGLNLSGAPHPMPTIPTSVRFAGDGSYIRQAASTALNVPALTVQAWIQTVQSTGTRQIAGKWTEGSVNGWRISVVNGHVHGEYATSKTNGIAPAAAGIDGGPVADGRPHLVTFTVDTTGGKLYVDGAKTASAAWTGKPAAPTGTAEFRVGLGYYSSAPTAATVAAASFAGNIDDVYVAKRVLSAAEIVAEVTNAPVVDTSTLFLWKLDEASTAGAAADATPNNRSGSFVNSPIAQAPALAAYGYKPPSGGGTAVALDGVNDAVTVPSTAAMEQLPLTIEAWVRTTQVDATPRVLISKQTHDTSPNGWALTLQNGELYPSWASPGGRIEPASAGIIADGRNHHIVWVVNTTQAVLYIDGRPQLTQTWSQSWNGGGPGAYVDNDPLRIGVNSAASPTYAAATIDEVAIHNRALTAAEVLRRSVYPHDAPAPTVVDLRLDETSGSTAANSASGQPAGTYSGGPTLGAAAVTTDPRDTLVVPTATTTVAPYTAETWFRTAAQGPMTVLAATGTGLQVDVNAATVVAHIPTANGIRDVTALAFVEDGKLHQVAVEVSPSSWMIFVDGAMKAAGVISAPQPLRQAGQSIRLGGAASGRAFVGWLEDVAIYPSAVDSADVQARWNRYAYNTSAPGPVADHLTSIDRDALGRTVGLNWKLADGSVVTDAVVRSQSGRVIDETIDGVDANPGGNNFIYDGAGRLVHAWVPGHELAYGFTDTGTCGSGASTTAGQNANRTSLVDNGRTTTYCYDQADKLIGSSDAASNGATYDGHGNATKLGTGTPVSFSYDSSDRHSGTTEGAVSVTMHRDVQGRLIDRTSSVSGTVRYGYTGSGDSADLVLNAAGKVIERLVALPGGVVLTQRTAGRQVWSFPNVHGDVMVTASDAGTRTSPTLNYDPFGQPLGGLPKNLTGGFQFGYLGQHTRPTDSEISLQPTEMGQRVYIPGLGRFLQTDPTEGGSCNDYDYVCADPVNGTDIDGNMCWSKSCLKARAAEIRRWAMDQAFDRIKKGFDSRAAHLKAEASRMGRALQSRTSPAAVRSWAGRNLRATANAGRFAAKLAKFAGAAGRVAGVLSDVASGQSWRRAVVSLAVTWGVGVGATALCTAATCGVGAAGVCEAVGLAASTAAGKVYDHVSDQHKNW